MDVISCPLIDCNIIPSRMPSWNNVEFGSTDVIKSPFCKTCGGTPKTEIRDKRTTAINIQILNVIFIYFERTI